MQLTKELSNSEDALRGLSGQITGYHEATRATTTAVAQRLSAFRSKLEERAALEARLEGLRLVRRLAACRFRRTRGSCVTLKPPGPLSRTISGLWPEPTR